MTDKPVPSSLMEPCVPIDFEEWDPSRGTLSEHVIAGSSAGLAEHIVMFPVDTIKVRAIHVTTTGGGI